MKRIALCLFFALLATSATFANSIFYDTTGTVFNCSGGNVTGCGSDHIILGGTIELSYIATSTNVTVDSVTPTTNANFGYLQAACVLDTACSIQGFPTGLYLNLKINQSQPDGPATGVVPTGLISLNSLSGTSSNAAILWDNTGFLVLSGPTAVVTYSLANNIFSIVPPNSCRGNGSNCGVTSLQGTITDPPPQTSAVPEPAVSLMFASGLCALGLVRRRK